MKIALLQSNYIPWKGNFDMINMSDKYVIYDEVQYTKGDWRNRNRIKTLNGTCQWLTIPVKLEHTEQTIDETHIADSKWKQKHWGMISSNYSKAPYFKKFKARIKDLYETTPEDKLSRINRHFIEGICDILKINTPIYDSREFSLIEGKQERIIDLCKKLEADVYLCGPAAKSYIQEELFEANGVKLEWMDYSGYPEYPQIAGDFEHAVSILDLLFSVGDDYPKYMKSY
ncbi:WbqC-like protein family [Verrucomicrobiia bacterium DG1235]|nr:WbqC-like protein family [Verrucomicrobiae bacterium DG1235]